MFRLPKIHMDLMGEGQRYLDPDPNLMLEDANANSNPKFHALNKAVVTLVSSRPG